MICLSGVEMTLLKCVLLFFCLSGCLCQRDCTGVDCPVLDNCIEEVLESGACCASCVQTGCSCEGYQYYDCVNAGFENGKVPEGDSYFVDYGSTECSCPAEGGRISCHFISCPDIPANCIEVSEPSDAGCVECQRVGCVQGSDKYEAGHSFQIDLCQVCHCPNNGGKLMCYPVPDCDHHTAHKPMLSTTTEDNTRGKQNDPNGFRQQEPVDHFSKPYRLSHRDSLSLFKPASQMDAEDFEDDYDYARTDLPEPNSEGLALPTHASPFHSVVSVSHPDRSSPHQTNGMGSKLELRERYGVHKQTTDSPIAPEPRTSRPFDTEDTTITWQRSSEVQSHTQRAPERKIYPLYLPKSPESKMNPLHLLNYPQRVIESQMHAQTSSESVILPLHSFAGTDSPISPQSGLDTQIYTERSSVTQTRPQNPFRGTESQTHPDYPFRSFGSHTPSQHPFQSSEKLLYPHHSSSGSERQFYSESGSESQIAHLQKPLHTLKSSDGEVNSEGTVPMDIPQPEEDKMDETELEGSEDEGKGVFSFKDGAGRQGTVLPHDIRLGKQESSTPSSYNIKSDGTDPALNYDTTTVVDGIKSPMQPELHTLPLVRFGPTSQPPLMVKPDGTEPPGKEPQTLFNFYREDVEEEGNNGPVFMPKSEGGPGVFAKDLVESCCEVGQKWASENRHCDHMPLLNNDELSICSVAQKQCCSGFLKETQCVAGMTAARAGDMCVVDGGDLCKDDSYQVCCSCCALGLRLRTEGGVCDAHQYLGYPCGHIFLTCCEKEEGAGQPTLRKKEKPRPTALPKKVLDSRFPKEAFSIDGPDEAANYVEQSENVDECQLHQGHLCQHTCTNTWASYSCGCHPGYALQPDGHSCVPVSPEEDNRVKEDDSSPAGEPGQTPAATITTTTASRPSQLQPCAGNRPCMQQCTVVAGQAHCSCFPGFSLKADRHMCEDVNECITNTHSCLPNERCVNTVGSFVCERPVTCPRGYQQRNGVCEDIDECMMHTHNCGVGFQCQNTDGTFLCNPKQKCLTGFTQDLHGNCIDINECSSLSEPCSAGFNCINTVGSYTCQRKIIMCSKGYHSSPDGAKCIDVDECQTGTHRCVEGQICHNLPGSYRCDCQTGYQYDAARQVCTDVNECWRYPGRLCAQTCENTPGSYHCACTAGFSLAFDGKNCEDLNECDKNPCSQECANIFGSYQCYCRQGFYLKEDGHTCDDIDECSQSIGNLCAFQCVNVPGSYQCACPTRGYTMSANGHACKDIDECTTGSHNCSLGQTCYNIQGSYRCLSFDCPQNYKKVSDTRCERTSCPTNSVACQSSALRITYYQLSFQTNIVIPAQIFRIGPSPTYSGDHIVISVVKGNEEGYFSTRKLNSFTGAVYLQRQVREPKDFLIDVEMKLLRQGSLTSFLARIYVFITTSSI